MRTKIKKLNLELSEKRKKSAIVISLLALSVGVFGIYAMLRSDKRGKSAGGVARLKAEAQQVIKQDIASNVFSGTHIPNRANCPPKPKTTSPKNEPKTTLTLFNERIDSILQTKDQEIEQYIPTMECVKSIKDDEIDERFKEVMYCLAKFDKHESLHTTIRSITKEKLLFKDVRDKILLLLDRLDKPIPYKKFYLDKLASILSYVEAQLKPPVKHSIVSPSNKEYDAVIFFNQAIDSILKATPKEIEQYIPTMECVKSIKDDEIDERFQEVIIFLTALQEDYNLHIKVSNDLTEKLLAKDALDKIFLLAEGIDKSIPYKRFYLDKLASIICDVEGELKSLHIRKKLS